MLMPILPRTPSAHPRLKTTHPSLVSSAPPHPSSALRNHQRAQEDGRSFIAKATFVQKEARPDPPQQLQPPPPPAAATLTAPPVVDNKMPQSVAEVYTVLRLHMNAHKLHVSCVVLCCVLSVLFCFVLFCSILYYVSVRFAPHDLPVA